MGNGGRRVGRKLEGDDPGEIVESKFAAPAKPGLSRDGEQEGGGNGEIVMVGGGGKTDEAWAWRAVGATVGLSERSRASTEARTSRGTEYDERAMTVYRVALLRTWEEGTMEEKQEEGAGGGGREGTPVRALGNEDRATMVCGAASSLLRM